MKILKDALFQIPGGNDAAAAAAFNIAALAAITHVNKFCGRFLNLQAAQTVSSTVCSKLFYSFDPNHIGCFGQSKDHQGLYTWATKILVRKDCIMQGAVHK